MIKNSMAEDLREARKKNGESSGNGDALGFGNAPEINKPAESENKIVIKTEDSLTNYKKPEMPAPQMHEKKEEKSEMGKPEIKKTEEPEQKSQPEGAEKKEESGLITNRNLQNLQKREGGRNGNMKFLIVAIALVLIGILAYLIYIADTGDEDTTGQSEETSAVEEENETQEEYENQLEEMAIRDDIRKDNLSIISDAIDNSYDETVGFPYSERYIRLNEESEIYERVKSYVMLAGFNEEESIDLMKDPNDPDFYFAYKSLTQDSFELTARLENTSDVDCDDSILETEAICIFHAAIYKDMIIKDSNIETDLDLDVDTGENWENEEDTWDMVLPDDMGNPDPLVVEE